MNRDQNETPTRICEQPSCDLANMLPTHVFVPMQVHFSVQLIWSASFRHGKVPDHVSIHHQQNRENLICCTHQTTLPGGRY